MLIVKVNKNENIDAALKRMKRKMNSTKIMRELKERREYEKPSVKKRKMKLNRIYQNQKTETL
jgi:small subunit ribosomal protein S21